MIIAHQVGWLNVQNQIRNHLVAVIPVKDTSAHHHIDALSPTAKIVFAALTKVSSINALFFKIFVLTNFETYNVKSRDNKYSV
ncbi:unnamed protein product [Enterobius vermicularis]|uniref:Uncharacterized protein n=1 Tax=Enterobius vermicularis TaxID=51028 RepID=A0A0N4VHK7_ENTVE|nr:unnamed protein product [Enterobius vermicularis]